METSEIKKQSEYFDTNVELQSLQCKEGKRYTKFRDYICVDYSVIILVSINFLIF